MEYYFMFNDNIISDIFLVTNIEKPLMPSKDIQTLDVLSRDGKVFNGSKYASIDIDVSILVSGETEEDLRMKLASLRDLLNSKKPVKVAFKKDRYGFGMVSDKISMDKKSATDVLCKVPITCHVPYFYSTEDKMFLNTADTKNISIENQGGMPIRPFITVGFSSNASFVQLYNTLTDERLLIGKYPKLEYNTVDESSDIINDACTTTGNWTTSNLPIDDNRAGGGTIGVTKQTSGLCIGALGSSSSDAKWKGVEVRRNLPTAVDEFKLRAEFTFTSTGVNGDPTVQPADKQHWTAGEKRTYYKVTSKKLNVRDTPSTNGKLLGTIKNGFEIRGGTVQGNWLQYKYSELNGSGFVFSGMKYLKACSETSQISHNVRNVVIKLGTFIYASPSADSTRLCSIKKGDIVRIDTEKEIYSYDSDNKAYTWYKLYTPYKGYNGYICKGNIEKWNDDSPVIKIEYEDTPETADDKTGVFELYGMGPNNERLFKISLMDDNEYYEYTQPSITVGTNHVLYKDNTQVPAPKSYTENSSGSIKNTQYLSGAVGSWNDFYGNVTLERKKDSKGNYTWSYTINKISSGNVVNQKTGTLQLNSVATEKLSYIILYMGTHDKLEKCADMALNSLRIQGETSNYDTNVNKVEFRKGDVIDIDFENRNVYLNEVKRNDLVDISSRYFNIDKGINPIKIFSNDENVVVGAAINEAWVGDE